MLLTDLSVKRPVLSSVLSILLVVLGLVAFDRLPLREYPDIDAPVVSVETLYQGAAASVVERRITKVIEDRIAGIEGIKNIVSTSSDGVSRINIEFTVARDIDAAANDVRDRVSRILDNLPDEIEPPEVSKAGADDDTIMWFNLVSERLSVLELTDYANRYLVDRFSVLDGVARVRVGGGLDYALRIWIDRQALAARNLTISDVEQALRRENVELPAGSVESDQVHFTVRLERTFLTAENFNLLPLAARGEHVVRLGDVARVELGAREERISFRGNGIPMVGIGITKQSTANTLEVARGARDLHHKIATELPAGIELKQSYDSSVFIEKSIQEVYQTLLISMGLVVLVIFVFLGNTRATFIPAITVPVSLLGTFIVLYALGFTINLLTLLAMTLAIGLVVDDAIVMLENVHRRIEKGEKPIVAAFLGARQVAFAIIATTLVLIAVFLPITFLEGDLGKLFTEFSVAMATAVAFSSLVALSLSPMLCSKLLHKQSRPYKITQWVDSILSKVRLSYQRELSVVIKKPFIALGVLALGGLAVAGLMTLLPAEFTPKEDRGAFFVIVTAPEGSSYEYSSGYMSEIERRLMPLVDSGEVKRLLVRAPRSFGSTADFAGGFVIVVLEDWQKRRPADAIMGDVRKHLSNLAGVRAFPVMRQALGRGFGKPVQFVLGGSSYEELAKWRDIVLEKAAENPKLIGLDHDYKETKPQVQVHIDTQRASDLGVDAREIGDTLAVLQGSKRVTTFVNRGEEYDVILEGERSLQNSPMDMANIYVRSRTTQKLIPLENLVSINEIADANTLSRFNRMRAITIEANLSPDYTLGEALNYLTAIAREHLPAEAVISFKGQSQDLERSGSSIYFIFALAIIVVFLVLAAQFESFVHPFVIMLAIPMAILGALSGLYIFAQSLNIYSQIGLIMLVGLAAKNGILIVEFINQLRDEGIAYEQAIIEASGERLRPILMTAITTFFGALPLVLATGAGSETRQVIGVVVTTGIVAATVFTLFIVPSMYALLSKHTGTTKHAENQLNTALKQRQFDDNS